MVCLLTCIYLYSYLLRIQSVRAVLCCLGGVVECCRSCTVGLVQSDSRYSSSDTDLYATINQT